MCAARTPNNIYRRFVQFEEKAAAVYLRLASRFAENPKLSYFWLDMAMTEKQHAGLLQFCLRERLFVPDLPANSRIHRIAGLFRSIEQRIASPQLTVDEAFALAMELERSELDEVYRHLTLSLHGSPYLLRRKIASLSNHLQNIITAGRQFGVAERILRPRKTA